LNEILIKETKVTTKEGEKLYSFSVPLHLYEEFHRLFHARGQKKAFFIRLMQLAVEEGAKSDFAKLIWDVANGRE